MRAGKDRRGFRNRARFLSGVLMVAAVFLVVRMYFVQVVHGQEYRAQASAQYTQPAQEMMARNDIFFTTKDGALVAAAVMQSGWRIAIKPKDIDDTAATYAALNEATPIDRERFFASAAKKDDPYEEVAFRVGDEAAKNIRAQKLPGVLLVADEWRAYPGQGLAGQALGFVGFRGDTKTGLYGLERYWNDTLVKNDTGLYVNPFAQVFTNVAALVNPNAAAEHGSIITSIEPAVQARLESALQDIMTTYSPKIAGGIVMDPHTGAIVAMAETPGFDPNTYNLVTNPSVFSMHQVESVYELGSIMKALTMAAALDYGVVSPATTYDDTGCITRSGAKICNYDHKARGVVSMQEVLNQSLNTGATFAEERLGRSVFTQYVKNYGLGDETGIDLPGEVAGKIGNLDHGADVDFASASFGQGIAVTPIAMIRALSALGNGGVLPTPHIAVGVRYESGITRSLVPTGVQPRVISATSSEAISTMLGTVFDKALLNGELKQEHYSIAAKTGTAQIAPSGGGGYYADRWLHSFFGYFPVHDPRYIILLYAVEPHGELYASHTLAKPFAGLATFMINYYNLPPDR